MQSSPYAPPSTPVSDPTPANLSEAEALRREHLRHEIQLKSAGSLYYFSGAMMLLMTVAMLLTPELSKGSTVGVMVYLGLFGGLTVLMLVLGFGLRRLRPWARIPTGVTSAVGLLMFPLGTLINAWILYLLFCEKGGTVLSLPYQEIRAETPHIQYQRSVGDWIAIGLLALLLIAIGVVIVLGINQG